LLCTVGGGALSTKYKVQYKEAVVYSMHGESEFKIWLCI